ncbi:TRAPP subunit bet5 [Apophysomyces ossiformis]|uniref:Trafficking protein particle complex subunit n=1 Tax=Apophysomyces ossiformis TaxID=679940 RepID=A0A8H7BJC7_9FUNG|nr:TRAPP subunit bet5 [Apophysomyces ossiformis]
MTIYNLYIFDRHCQCIYFQKWTHQQRSTGSSNVSNSASHSASHTSRPGQTSDHSTANSASLVRSEERLASHTGLTHLGTQQSGLAAGSVISIEEEAKLVYGVILSLRNFVRKLSGSQDGFISYKTSTYRMHYYETPTGLKFVMNSDPNTKSLRAVLKEIYVQLYVEFVVKNGLMRFDDTRWEISQGYLPHDANAPPPPEGSVAGSTTIGSAAQPLPPPPGNISNELFRAAVDKFIRSLTVFQ